MKNIFSTDESVKINWFASEKYFCTDESVKRQITDSISEDSTDSDLESVHWTVFFKRVGWILKIWHTYRAAEGRTPKDMLLNLLFFKIKKKFSFTLVENPSDLFEKNNSSYLG